MRPLHTLVGSPIFHCALPLSSCALKAKECAEPAGQPQTDATTAATLLESSVRVTKSSKGLRLFEVRAHGQSWLLSPSTTCGRSSGARNDVDGPGVRRRMLCFRVRISPAFKVCVHSSHGFSTQSEMNRRLHLGSFGDTECRGIATGVEP